MRLATIDPHSQKKHTEIYKIPEFGVYRTSFGRDTAMLKRQNLQRNVWPAIHFFANFDIFKWLYHAYFWVYLHQT